MQTALVHQWVSADPNMKKQVKASLLATLGTQVGAACGPEDAWLRSRQGRAHAERSAGR